MIELLLGIVLGVITLFLIKKGIQESEEQQQAAGSVVAAAQQEIKTAPVLLLEPAEPFNGNVSFLKSFGIQSQYLADIKVFKGANQLVEQLPPKIKRCLEVCYQEGGCRGPEIPGLLCRNEPLEQGKALYFALLKYSDNTEPEIVCFVDKVRSL